MIEFPKDYFQKEIRSGFMVSSMMKRAWAAQLKVLHYIIAVCKKYDLAYYGFFGTLLGAVRHKGFIPWDDDLDIAMKRQDYLKFLSIAKSELPEKFCVLSIYTEEKWNNSFARVTNSHSINVSEEHLQQYYGCPFVVGVDIFPMDYVPEEAEAVKEQDVLLGLTRNMLAVLNFKEEQIKKGNLSDDLKEYDDILEEGLGTLQNYCGDSFSRVKSQKNRIMLMYDRLCMLGRDGKGSQIKSFQIQQESPACCFPVEWLDSTVDMGFELMRISIPEKYDEILKVLYGNYMIMRIQPNHDYPFFKEQLQLLMEQGIWNSGEEEPLIPQSNEKSGINYQDSQLPLDWSKLFIDENGKKKKAILYHTSLAGMLRGEKRYLRKMRAVLEIFEAQTDVVLWWMPHAVDNCTYKHLEPELFKEYEMLCGQFESCGWGIFDNSGLIGRAIENTDGFYGDYGPVLELYKETGKPIMIQNITVF